MNLSLIWKIIKNLPALLPLIRQLIDLFGEISDGAQKKSLADKIRKGVETKRPEQIAKAYKKVIRAGAISRDK